VLQGRSRSSGHTRGCNCLGRLGTVGTDPGGIPRTGRRGNMTTIEQMAQILEDAADLYQAEQVNWCAGAWYKDDNGDSDVSNLKPGSALSVCASTALGM